MTVVTVIQFVVLPVLIFTAVALLIHDRLDKSRRRGPKRPDAD